MFQRYHAMHGRELRYQNGFDCQGLWVEVEVEKELGFRTKADIVAFGVDRFVRACKERVLTYAARQTEQSIRLGYWMDWDEPDTLLRLRDALREGEPSLEIRAPSGETASGPPERIVARLGCKEWGGSYFTFSSENNYTIWRFLKRCHEEGFVYRGTDVMPWCCRCGTGLSQMEVAEGRKIVSHSSVFVRFPLRGRDREALLVWTTTPWTLTANVAAAVNPEMTYLRVRHGEWTYYLGKDNFERDRVQELEVAGRRETHKLHSLRTILKGSGPLGVCGELRGEELVGLAYEGPFDHLPAQRQPGGVTPFKAESASTATSCHRVIPWKEVSGTEGTGIVHVAPGCGAEDHRLGAEHGLVAVAPLDEGGAYVDGFGELSGRSVLGVADEIVADLRARGVLVARESYPHVYPHCWRCKEELVFRLVDEWFIRMDWRDRIQRIVPQVRWIPAEGEAREQDWLKNMGDWMISKKRFWGLALPIWVCGSCDAFDVIGGEDELRERTVEGWDAFAGQTPHRPWIDAVKIACPGGCGGTASRIEDVGNPWLDAGIVPFSTLHWNTDRAYWDRWFPADFVVECFPGQFRNWFYSLLAMSAMLADRAPFEVLLGHALVRDARGHEMHKSAGNAIAFDEAAETFGAEVMRYLYASQNPVQNLNFPDLHATGGSSKATADGEVRSKLLTFWNCYSFFVTYASLDGWRPGRAAAALPSELDRWIESRLQRLVEAAHAAFADFALFRLVEQFERFDEELSNWYLRRSRRRFWRSGDDADKEAAYRTLYRVLTTVTRVMAPILPFLSEEIYQNLVRSVAPEAPESVHLDAYPQVDAGLVDSALETRVDCVIRTRNQALALREQARLKIRQPLATLTVRPRDEADRAVLADAHFAAQVCDECNVKRLELIEDEGALVSARAKPNWKALGPRYGKRTKAIASHLARADVAAIQSAFREEGAWHFELDGETLELGPADVQVELEGPEHLVVASEGGAFLALDVRITPELEQEGIARDFNRQAQDRRKSAGLEVGDRIELVYTASDRVAEAVAAHDALLREELLAARIERLDALAGGGTGKVGGEEVRIEVRRLRDEPARR
jgi:isoleucyl-tRNA synthetase